MALGTAAAIGLGVGGSLLSSALGAKGAGKAADAQAAGIDRQIDYLTETRDLVRSDFEPYRLAGYEALDAALSLVGLPSVGGAPSTSGGGSGTSASRVEPSRATSLLNPVDLNASAYTWGNPSGLDGVDNRSLFDAPVEPIPRASGGPVEEGQVYTVGETGPETLVMGADGGYVVPENPGGQEGRYNFMADPGYNFRFSEGVRALDRSASAAGRLNSGGTGRALIRYGQGVASDEYQRVYNRIAGIAGLGQQAIGGGVGATTALGQSLGNAASSAGSAAASGYLGQYGSYMQGLNQVALLGGQYS